MALITLDDLLSCLQVRELRPGVWTAPSLEMDYPRVFGGQLLAQAVTLGAATTEGKTVKSLSCLFPREARRAGQQGKTVFVALVSMHVPEPETPPDLEHQDPAPETAKPGEAVDVDLNMIPWATRVVGGTDLRDRERGPADFAFWTRVLDRRLPDDLTVHQALLAHATDLTVVGTVLRPVEGISQADAGSKLHTAVTSHTMWFHRPFRIDDWCHVAQHSPTLAGGRGFGHGHAYSRGALVASFGQECMIRPTVAG